MEKKYKVFFLGLRAGASAEAVERVIAESVGISNQMERKRILFETPSLIYEACAFEDAERIRREFEAVGARIEVKSPVFRTAPRTENPTLANRTAAPSHKTGLVVGIIVLLAFVAAAVFHSRNRREMISPPKTHRLVVKKENGSNRRKPDDIPLNMAHPPSAPLLAPRGDSSSELERAQKAMKNKDFAQAWKILSTYANEHPNDASAMKGLKYAAFMLARNAYKRGDVEGAIDYTDALLQFTPQDPDVFAQLGALYYARKDYDSARSYLNDAADLGSRDPNVHLLLAKICYYHDDDMLGAKNHLRKALEQNPARSDIKAFLGKITREYSIEGNFQAAESEHFVVKYEGVEDSDAAYTVLYILDQAWSDIGYDLGDYPDDPVVVILYTRKQFSDVTRAPHWSGGIYDGRIRLPVAGLPDKSDDDLRRLLYHEYTHVIVHRITGGRCPVWLNEGLAQLMQIRSGASPDPWMKPSVLGNRRSLPSLRALSAPFLNLNSQDAVRAYVTSYFAVKYFVDEYGLTSASRVLEELGKKKSFDDALYDVTGTDIVDFEKRFHRYLEEQDEDSP